MSSLSLIAEILSFASAAFADAFVIHYSIAIKWWKTPMGRHLQAFMVVSAVLLNMGVIRQIGGADLDTGWFAWMRFGAFCFLPVVLGWRYWILVKLQIEERRKRKECDDEASEKSAIGGGLAQAGDQADAG